MRTKEQAAKELEEARVKRVDRARERFEKTKLLTQAGMKPIDIATFLKISSAAVSVYRRFETFEDFQGFNRQEKVRRDAQQSVLLAEGEFKDDAVAPHLKEVVGARDIHDPLARRQIETLQIQVADLTERLAWIEGNAVIDTNHKNKIRFSGRG